MPKLKLSHARRLLPGLVICGTVIAGLAGMAGASASGPHHYQAAGFPPPPPPGHGPVPFMAAGLMSSGALDRFCDIRHGRVTGRMLDRLAEKLALGEEQKPALASLKEAVKASGKKAEESCDAIDAQADREDSLSGRLERMEIMLSHGAEILGALRPAIDSFRASLTAEQQEKFDAFVSMPPPPPFPGPHFSGASPAHGHPAHGHRGHDDREHNHAMIQGAGGEKPSSDQGAE